jgi:hypothetical protein
MLSREPQNIQEIPEFFGAGSGNPPSLLPIRRQGRGHIQELRGQNRRVLRSSEGKVAKN